MTGNDGLGIIAEYKYETGKYAGRIFRKRFERTEDFLVWSAAHRVSGDLKILKFKQVETGKLYWVDRYVTN